MKNCIYLIIAAGSLFANTASADDANLTQINNVIQQYFEGTSQAKPELIRKAFLPSLELQTVRNGQLVRRKRDDYIRVFEKGKPHDRVGRVISIDVSNDAAVAKAEILMGGKVYIDYFLLLKLKSGWKITNKIYTKLR